MTSGKGCCRPSLCDDVVVGEAGPSRVALIWKGDQSRGRVQGEKSGRLGVGDDGVGDARSRETRGEFTAPGSDEVLEEAGAASEFDVASRLIEIFAR